MPGTFGESTQVTAAFAHVVIAPGEGGSHRTELLYNFLNLLPAKVEFAGNLRYPDKVLAYHGAGSPLYEASML